MSTARDIILFNGMPGSGTSDLCHNIVSELHYEYSLEHIDASETIRAIGKEGIDSYYRREIQNHLNGPQSRLPINRKLMYDIISEALSRHDGIDLLLINGYPSYSDQVEDIYELAMLDARALRGAIITEASEKVAINRLTNRTPLGRDRPIGEYKAEQKIQRYKNTFPTVRAELWERGLPIETINTIVQTPDIIDHAIQTINYMTSPCNDI
jgi:adenylate kinase family enzyme